MVHGALASPFFIVLIVVSNYMLLGLVVALLTSSFEVDDDDDRGGSSSATAPLAGKDSAKQGEGAFYDADAALLAAEAASSGCLSSCVAWCARVPSRIVTEVEHITRRDKACLCMSRIHPVRRTATYMVEWRWRNTAVSFDNIVIALIVLSSVELAMSTCDLDPASQMAETLSRFDHLCVGVFTLEMITKILSHGLLFTRKAYLRSAWNWLDGFIVLASLLSSSPAFRPLRVLRVLRPLRLVSRFEGMRLAVTLLIRAIPGVMNVLSVYVLFLVVFAILGVQLFAGKLRACQDDLAILTEAACVGAGYEWSNSPMGSFDNVFSSMLLLFELSSFEGWVNVLFAGMDTTAVGQAPQRNASPMLASYFIAWVVISGFCLLNMLVGVLCSTYQDILRQSEEDCLLSEKQRKWLMTISRFLEYMPKPRPQAPQAAWRRSCYRLVVHWHHFDLFMLCVILFNTCLLALDGAGLSEAQSQLLYALDLACIATFVAEAIAKLAACGPRYYMRDAWNVFDFGIVVLALAEQVMLAFSYAVGGNPTLGRVLRVLRVVRVLRTVRVVKSVRGLKTLLTMLVCSLPSLLNIISIFLLILIMYSLLAMQLFGRVAHGEHINSEVNFCDFPAALFTMFRAATGEGWNDLMHEAMITPESGKCDATAGNCGTWLAVPFFVSYVLISTFIVFKMLIALILEQFMQALQRDANQLDTEHADLFVDKWGLFDPEATGWIPARKLMDLLRLLPPPLGLDPAHYDKGHIKSNDYVQYAFHVPHQ
jgi:hypothetical protein